MATVITDDKNVTPPYPRIDTLPETIGVCMSGGGFRAAAFHLGTLAYLHRVGLLDKVKLISTVSGGTFTGAKYALSLTQKMEFERFFRDYYDELREPHIFTNALSLLSDGSELDTPSRRKKLITCAAQSYSTTLFADRTDPTKPKPYLLGALASPSAAPLEEMCFNTTDFRRGLAFRFQSTKDGYNGNLRAHIDSTHANVLRLGDIVAASSCFPGGFEPIDFPNDFVWPGTKEKPGTVPVDVKSLFECEPTSLMDGGVYDNQGLESLLLADGRRTRVGKPAADLFILSDTDRQQSELYELPQPLKADAKNLWLRLLLTVNPSLNWISRGVWAIYFLCGLTAVAIGVDLAGRIWRGESVLTWSVLFTSCIPLLLALVASLGAGAARSFVKTTLLPLVPELGAEAWVYLQRVRLRTLLDMLNARLTSIMALTMDVFMKRIRSMGYTKVYEDSKLKGRLMSNYVYHLSGERGQQFFQNPVDSGEPFQFSPELLAYLRKVPAPSRLVECLAAKASSTGTKLWFDSDDELPMLVAAGQVTTCFNLMKFVARTRSFDDDKKSFTGPSGALWQQFHADWIQFQVDPRFALMKLLADPGKKS